MPPLEDIQRGVASLLTDYENSGAALSDPDTITAEDAAKAIVWWVLAHEGSDQLVGKMREVHGQPDTSRPDLNDIVYRKLGLPRD